MFLQLSQVLASTPLSRLRQLCEHAPFADGQVSAGWHARIVKANEQLHDPAAQAEAAQLLVQALDAQPVFRAAVLPRLYGPVLLARYRPGMHYGTHIDEPLLGRNPPIRSDVALTVFLDPTDAYDGGELVLEGVDGERAVKLAAGDAFVYPATTLHRVAAVTRGERHVLVAWVQSHVRDAACREMLFDLDRAGRGIFEREGKSEHFDLVMKTRANLIRRWADG